MAAAYTALQERNRVLVSGEPGIGKSILGVTLAAAVGKDRQPGQVVMIMCPPQLTGKWKREIERAVGLSDRYAAVLSRVDEVRDFMARAKDKPDVLHIGIMSREMAKLGSGWQHALHWQAVRQALWPQGTPPPDELANRERIATAYVPCCPTCAEPVRKASTGDLLTPRHFGYDPTTRTYDNQKRTRTQYHCRQCGSALYQITRLKGSQPGPGEKFPKRNPRMPLAEFIARVYPGRVALSIIDEVHQCKSLSADQGRAMTHLVNCSDKSVGLSGTIFGGLASSLYLLLFMFSRHIRTTYPFGSGGQQRFVENMGVLEEVIEDRPQYENGVYSGTKRYDSGLRESPGCSPRLVVETLPCTVFAGLRDIGTDMPALIETPVAVTPDPDMARAYDLGEQKLKDYLAGLRYTGKQWTFMGAYLQALMNYPDACVEAYPVYHKEFDATVWTFPGLGEDQLFAKEKKLIEIVRQELSEGRKVTVFVRQTGKRDVQRRLAKLLTEHVPGAKPYIMYGGNNGGSSAEDGIPSASVPTQRRERALDEMLAKGRNVLICNPMLVETGLDLINLPTIIFYELLFSLYPIDQASRRHWRIIQQQECRRYYLFYEGTMEERALEMLAKKRDAAQILYGDMSATGLAALTGEGGIANDLVKALEQALQAEDNPTTLDGDTDLQTLFERTSLVHYESPWTLAVQAEGVQAESEVIEVPAVQPEAVPVKIPPVIQSLPPRSIRHPQLPKYQPVPSRSGDAVQPRLF